MINKLYEIVDTPFFMIVFVLIMILFAIQLLVRLIKINKKPEFGLYDTDNLKRISFAIQCAIDGYQDHYLPEELEIMKDYNDMVDLYLYVSKLLGEK